MILRIFQLGLELTQVLLSDVFNTTGVSKLPGIIIFVNDMIGHSPFNNTQFIQPVPGKSSTTILAAMKIILYICMDVLTTRDSFNRTSATLPI